MADESAKASDDSSDSDSSCSDARGSSSSGRAESDASKSSLSRYVTATKDFGTGSGGGGGGGFVGRAAAAAAAAGAVPRQVANSDGVGATSTSTGTGGGYVCFGWGTTSSKLDPSAPFNYSGNRSLRSDGDCNWRRPAPTTTTPASTNPTLTTATTTTATVAPRSTSMAGMMNSAPRGGVSTRNNMMVSHGDGGESKEEWPQRPRREVLLYQPDVISDNSDAESEEKTPERYRARGRFVVSAGAAGAAGFSAGGAAAATAAAGAAVDHIVTGLVSAWKQAGYGFVVVDSGRHAGESVFVHLTNTGGQALHPGTRVVAEGVYAGPKTLCAHRVHVLPPTMVPTTRQPPAAATASAGASSSLRAAGAAVGAAAAAGAGAGAGDADEQPPLRGTVSRWGSQFGFVDLDDDVVPFGGARGNRVFVHLGATGGKSLYVGMRVLVCGVTDDVKGLKAHTVKVPERPTAAATATNAAVRAVAVGCRQHL